MLTLIGGVLGIIAGCLLLYYALAAVARHGPTANSTFGKSWPVGERMRRILCAIVGAGCILVGIAKVFVGIARLR
jgi:ABC-type antimicrobial peptide transport system permease subunit